MLKLRAPILGIGSGLAASAIVLGCLSRDTSDDDDRDLSARSGSPLHVVPNPVLAGAESADSRDSPPLDHSRSWIARPILKKSALRPDVHEMSNEYAIEDDGPAEASTLYRHVTLDIDPNDALRTVTRRGDVEYIETEPSVEIKRVGDYATTLERARTEIGRPGELIAVEGPVPAISPPPDSAFGLYQDTVPARDVGEVGVPFYINNANGTVFSPDDRFWIAPANRFIYPRPTNIILIAGSTGRCSATMVGRRTFLSSAHCFYNASTQSWLPSVTSVAFGNIYFRWNGSSPFTQFTTHASVTGCFSLSIPLSYISTNGSTAFDYAVMEFGCGLNPGDSVGYLPIGWGTNADYANSSQANLIAYDHAYVPPQPTNGNEWAYPSIITRTRGPYGTSVVNDHRTHIRGYMGGAKGASGAGLNQKLFSTLGDQTLYYTGTLHGKESPTAEPLWFRRMEPNYFAFVSANTTEW